MPTRGRFSVRQIDNKLAFTDDRLLVLRNLIAGRQIGIEIILPVEDRMKIDLRFEAEPVFTACRTQKRLITGSMPGMARPRD